jgi:hypothetical protein
MKIISYNPETFSLTNQQSKLNDINLYNWLVNHNFSKDTFLVDRTQSIPHYLDIDYSYSPIPANPNFSLDLNTIVKNRCIELLSTGKQISVAWSGGVDSTFVLLALHHYANDPDQVKVYGTYNSIIESGDLFDRFIKDSMPYHIKVNTSASNNFTDKDCIYVTGAMSNQLFTQSLLHSKRDSILQFKDDYSVENTLDCFYKDVLTDSCLEFLEPSILKIPRNLNTIQDLRWFMNFNFSWYNVLTSTLIGLDKDTANKVHAFFNTEDFQLWAIYNNDIATKTGDYSDERWQLREAITEYTGDSYYSNNKKKFTSVLSPTPHNWLYLLNDYTNVYV